MSSSQLTVLYHAARNRGYSPEQAQAWASQQAARQPHHSRELAHQNAIYDGHMSMRDSCGRLPVSYGGGSSRSAASHHRVADLRESHRQSERQRGYDRGSQYRDGRDGRYGHTSDRRGDDYRDTRRAGEREVEELRYLSAAEREGTYNFDQTMRRAGYGAQDSYGGESRGSGRHGHGSSRADTSHPYGYDEVDDQEYTYRYRR